MKLTLDVHVHDEYFDGPEKAIVEIDRKYVAHILELSKVVKNLKVYCIEEFDYSPEYFDVDYDNEEKLIPNEDFRAEAVLLHITETNFYWGGLVKHTNIHWETGSAPIKLLQEAMRVWKTPKKNLPTLIGSLKHPEVALELERRLKGK